MKSTGVPESKLTLNSAETNPANLKFITPYNNFDPSTQSQSNLIMKSTMSAPPPMTNNPSSSGISNHSTEANEPTGGGYVKASGEVATITVDLSKFNVALALDENNRFLEEWEKLLEKTENTSIESLSKGVIQRHEYLKRKLHENLGIMAKLVQNQMKQKRLDEASAAVHAAPSNEGRDAEGTISQVESKSDLSTNSHSIVESKTNNS